MLVGEAPGAEEEKKGLPFVGSAGKLMRALVRHCGINPSACYITNVVNERPPGNKFEYFYESKGVPSKTLEAFQESLCNKIERIHPEVVILMGAEALKAVTNKSPITAWRGTFLTYKGIKLLPTFHPAAILRNYNLHPIFEMDVTKATSRRPREWPRIITKPSLHETLTFLRHATIFKPLMTSWDIETVGKEIRSLAFSYRNIETKEVKAISIPFIRFPSSSHATVEGSLVRFPSSTYSSYWKPNEERLVLEAIAGLFDSGIPFIGQNSISFDEPLFFRSFRMRLKNHFYDLMHMWHQLYSEFPKSLAFICSVLLDYPNYWTLKDTLIDSEEWTYNAQDAIVTLEAGEKVIEELEESRQTHFYRNHIHPLAQALVKLDERGILVDEKRRREHLETQKIRAEQAQKALNEHAGHSVNPGSPKQVADYLYKELSYPTITNPKTKSVTTDEEAIRKLAKRYSSEKAFQLILDYRKATKLTSTYLNVKTGEGGRMHSSFNPSGTETGRLSSSKNLFGEGMNLQNIPAGKRLDIVNIRDIFIAEPGSVLLKGDLKQAETMVVGDILDRLGFPQMHDHYQEEGFDVHTWAASHTFKKPEDQITKAERDVAKIRNHSGNYMAGPNVMVKTALNYGVDIDYQLAKQLIRDVRTQIPGITIWWNWVGKQIKTKRMLTNCFGRRRMFFGRTDDSTTIREAVAWEPQSTVGDLTNRILIELDRTLPEGIRVLLQVHDELVLEVKESMLEQAIRLFKRAAIVPLAVSPNHTLVIPLEISVGKNWKDMKEVA
jgi:uracil-DNA glycosylase family 4